MSFDELIIDTQTQHYTCQSLPIELLVSYASFLYRSGLVVYLLVSCPSIGPALYFIFIYLVSVIHILIILHSRLDGYCSRR